jgi:hypothetical protein
LCGFCHLCPIRACALDKGVPNCAHCPAYACEQLESFFVKTERFLKKWDGFVVRTQDVRAVLTEIHRSL